MVYRFIATTLFNGNKRLTMHSYREQMRNHNGRQYHLQSGIGRQATGNIVYLLLMQGKHIDFKINWTYPFELTEYMLPNKINWIIEQEKSNTLYLTLKS